MQFWARNSHHGQTMDKYLGGEGHGETEPLRNTKLQLAEQARAAAFAAKLNPTDGRTEAAPPFCSILPKADHATTRLDRRFCIGAVGRCSVSSPFTKVGCFFVQGIHSGFGCEMELF